MLLACFAICSSIMFPYNNNALLSQKKAVNVKAHVLFMTIRMCFKCTLLLPDADSLIAQLRVPENLIRSRLSGSAVLAIQAAVWPQQFHRS